MTGTTNNPKIFISYSWKPIQNKQKVNSLAERLTNDGVHVIFDDWDLKEGQDKYTFMEQMINDSDVKRVLLICNKEYMEKANQKKGGVGIESLIVSNEIYSKVDQTKFIPIVFEYDENGKPFVPTFVNTRIFIDLSNDEIFEENYELLLRNIYNKPISKRPPIGSMPNYIETEEPIHLPTAHKVMTIKNALLSEKKNINLLIKDYLNSFYLGFKSFEISGEIIGEKINKTDFIEAVQKNIDNLIVLRDDFINFIDTYTSYSQFIDIERIHSFFEKLLDYDYNNEYRNYPPNSVGYLINDGRRFFYYELFLTFCTLFIEKERFDELAYILHTPYIIHNSNKGEMIELSFTQFRQFVSTLNEHKNRKFKMDRISVTADIIKLRATKNIIFEKLIETDILLFYISQLNQKNPNDYQYWFPETSCYSLPNIVILKKTCSERYFNKVKVLFGVNNKDELLKKVEIVLANNVNYVNRAYYYIPNIKVGLHLADMCKFK